MGFVGFFLSTFTLQRITLIGDTFSTAVFNILANKYPFSNIPAMITSFSFTFASYIW